MSHSDTKAMGTARSEGWATSSAKQDRFADFQYLQSELARLGFARE